MAAKTMEKQYNLLLKYREENGLESLGLMTSQAWFDDPRRLTFTLSRYKFVSKMLSGSKNVLEVGCADAFGTRIVLQEVEKLTATDFDPLFVDDTKQRMDKRWSFDCEVHDMLSGSFAGEFDGIYALDVLEHIDPFAEEVFLKNMVTSLTEHGTMIIGMPSLESQLYASTVSKEGHVNCKTMPDFKRLMQKFFYNVYMFSMNDEVVHTGYHKMSHYLFALCSTKK
jgi:cyclopropane fatty-acyl-phospholipid synthase-like methyltransferase